MRIRHHPSVDSRMSRYWKPTDTFDLCDDFGNIVLTLTGQQMISVHEAHWAQAGAVLGLAEAISRTGRDLFPRRRLLGQHKPLKGR